MTKRNLASEWARKPTREVDYDAREIMESVAAFERSPTREVPVLDLDSSGQDWADEMIAAVDDEIFGEGQAA